MLNKLKKYIPYIAIICFIVIFKPSTHVTFWETSFKLLMVIMFSRPLRDIFPKLKFLNKIVWIRKELWILAWAFAITHSIWFFLDTKVWLDLILNKNIRYINSQLAWWIVAFFASIPLTITSNKFSMKKLGWKNWKRLQYLAYVMFLATLVHIGLVNNEETNKMIVIIVIYILLYTIAYFIKSKRWKRES